MRYLAVESSVTKQNMVASIQAMPTTWLSVDLADRVESVKFQGKPVYLWGSVGSYQPQTMWAPARVGASASKVSDDQ